MLETRPPSVSEVPGQPPSAEPREAEGAELLGAEIARAVRELRLAAGLSERGAARLLRTSQTQLRRMEDPRYLPSLRSLARLAAAYGHRLRVDFQPREARKAARPAARVKPPGPRKAATARGRAQRRRG